MKTAFTLCFVSIILSVQIVVAQKISFGPKIGLINQAEVGRVLLDSVQVELQRGGGLRGYFGGFISYSLNSAFRITSGLNYYPSYSSYIVYNTRKDCQFCPLVKAGGLAQTSLEVPLVLEFNIPFTEGKFFALAGLAPSIRLERKGDAYYYHRDAGQGVSDVIPAMRSVIKPIVWDYSLGAGINVWRLRFEARYQANLSESATNPVKVWEKSYDFRSAHANMRFGVGYNLNWKHKE